MNRSHVTYFVEYIRGGDPDTELIRDPSFEATDEFSARAQAQQRLIQAGVDFGTLYCFRDGNSGPTTELGRVDVFLRKPR
jgi:hypothetical protein